MLVAASAAPRGLRWLAQQPWGRVSAELPGPRTRSVDPLFGPLSVPVAALLPGPPRAPPPPGVVAEPDRAASSRAPCSWYQSSVHSHTLPIMSRRP